MLCIVASRHAVCKINDGNSPLILPMASRHYNSEMVDKPYPSDAADKFIVRLPPGMREQLSEAAKTNGRSMNSEVVWILQEHFDRIYDESESRREGEKIEERIGISFGLKHPLDRAAVLKALLFSELQLLRSRVDLLGGRDAVIEMSPAEIAKLARGPRIEGTEEEQASYFSRVVKNAPLTAVLTTQEIDSLARRVAMLHAEQTASGMLANAAKPAKPKA